MSFTQSTFVILFKTFQNLPTYEREVTNHWWEEWSTFEVSLTKWKAFSDAFLNINLFLYLASNKLTLVWSIIHVKYLFGQKTRSGFIQRLIVSVLARCISFQKCIKDLVKCQNFTHLYSHNNPYIFSYL